MRNSGPKFWIMKDGVEIQCFISPTFKTRVEPRNKMNKGSVCSRQNIFRSCSRSPRARARLTRSAEPPKQRPFVERPGSSPRCDRPKPDPTGPPPAWRNRLTNWPRETEVSSAVVVTTKNIGCSCYHLPLQILLTPAFVLHSRQWHLRHGHEALACRFL